MKKEIDTLTVTLINSHKDVIVLYFETDTGRDLVKEVIEDIQDEINEKGFLSMSNFNFKCHIRVNGRKFNNSFWIPMHNIVAYEIGEINYNNE